MLSEDEIRKQACSDCGLGLVMTGGRYFLVASPNHDTEVTVKEIALVDDTGSNALRDVYTCERGFHILADEDATICARCAITLTRDHPVSMRHNEEDQ